MRGVRASCFLVLPFALAAACASSTPVHDSSGVGGAAGTSTVGSFVATTGSGAPSCGIDPGDPACRACINARCCSQGRTCGDDPACAVCLGAAAPAPSCGSNQALSAFTACLQTDCAARCVGSFTLTSSSASGSGGAAASSSSAAASSSSSAAASSSSSAAASSSSSAAASSSSSAAASSSSSSAAASSSGASSSSGGGPPPCASVNNGIGCCDGGGILRYCDTMSTVHSDTCGAGSVCGWNPSFGFYDCVAPPGGADPSGTYPLACGG